VGEETESLPLTNSKSWGRLFLKWKAWVTVSPSIPGFSLTLSIPSQRLPEANRSKSSRLSINSLGSDRKIFVRSAEFDTINVVRDTTLCLHEKPMNNPARKLKQFALKSCGRTAKSALQRFPDTRKSCMPEKLRLLLVENSIHAELSIVNELHCAGFEVSHKRVETTGDFQAELKEKPWDVIICDYCLRGADGVTMLQLYQQLGLDIPFIMVSATVGEDLAVDALKAGANDYVMKQNLSRLVPAINRELRAAQERQIRRRIETTQVYLASVVESCNDAIIGETLDGRS
jgi:PleD family two-component response regulator